MNVPWKNTEERKEEEEKVGSGCHHSCLPVRTDADALRWCINYMFHIWFHFLSSLSSPASQRDESEKI
jgi:hypothetical protein